MAIVSTGRGETEHHSSNTGLPWVSHEAPKQSFIASGQSCSLPRCPSASLFRVDIKSSSLLRSQRSSSCPSSSGFDPYTSVQQRVVPGHERRSTGSVCVITQARGRGCDHQPDQPPMNNVFQHWFKTGGTAITYTPRPVLT